MPAALFIVAGLIAAPAGWRAFTSEDEPARETLAVVIPDVGMLTPAERVALWEGRIQPGDGDYLNRTNLAEAELVLARQTGDLDAYRRAEIAVDEALDANPDYIPAAALKATILLSAHDFVGAEQVAASVASETGRGLAALTVVGDARLELGDLAGASTAYDTVANGVGPSAPVLVRQARLAWLQGDTQTALDLGERSVAAAIEAGASGADLAFYQVQLATIRFDTGDIAGSIALAEAAVANAPALPAALANLGRAVAGSGDLERAAVHYEAAVAIVPTPAYLGALGDIYAALGRDGDAQLQYDTVGVIATLAEVNEVVYNREHALFLAEHGLDLDRAVELARQELNVRQDAEGYHTLAWAMYQAGDVAGAADTIERALETGIADPRLLAHAGIILAGSGDGERGRQLIEQALAINPQFDPLQAPLAAATLAHLEGNGS